MKNEQQNTRRQVDEQKQVHRSIIAKTKLLYWAFVVLSIFVILTIVYIQVGPSSSELKSLSSQYSIRKVREQAARGNILSDDGRILVTSIPLYKIRMDLAADGLSDTIFNGRVAELSEKLSDFFGDTTAQGYQSKLIKARAEKKRYYDIVPRRVNFVELQKLQTFPIFEMGRPGGFIAERTYNRVRPFGNIASRTIGFVNSNGVKLGLEGGFDNVLRGIEGLTVKQKISGNFWVPIQSESNIEPTDGLDLYSTINIEMQDIVQNALREQVVSLEADWGTVVVMEVETGYIKAIANITRKRDGTLVEDYNYAVGMSQEPGSTFKLPVLLTLLENTKINLSTHFNTEKGVVDIGEARVVDTRQGGYGIINMEKIFGNSSNIGMAKAVNSVYDSKPWDFVDAIKEMGYGRELGLQIAGEPRPTIKHPRERASGWDGTSLTMMSYGYALRVTPLQTLALYNAVANGGRLMKPILVQALMEKGKEVQRFEPEILINQIASTNTINQAQKALEYVVTNGTAKILQNRKYSVAAKTGTAQIAQGSSGYLTKDGSRHYLGSIAGYFPANKPKYSMIVALKTYYAKGSDRIYYGGALAAPLFKVIADNIYSRSLDFVTPYRGGEGARAKGVGVRSVVRPEVGVGGGSGGKKDVPSVVGMDFSTALMVLENRGFRVQCEGVGRVVSQRFVTDSLGGERVELEFSLK